MEKVNEPLAVSPPALTSCIEFSKTPVASVVFEWANGRRILALPISYIPSAEWLNLDGREDQKEEITIPGSTFTITLRGSGLRVVPGELTRGQITTIREISSQAADQKQGPVVTSIEVVEREQAE
jgi:hypothetical protein